MRLHHVDRVKGPRAISLAGSAKPLLCMVEDGSGQHFLNGMKVGEADAELGSPWF